MKASSDSDTSSHPLVHLQQPQRKLSFAGEDDDEAKAFALRIEAGEVASVCVELQAAGSLPLFKLIFDHLSSYGRMDVFRALSPELRRGTFSYLRPSEKSLIILEASIGDAEAYVLALPAAERLEAIPSISGLEKILHVLSAEEKTACDLRRRYPKDSVGSLMHRVPDGMTLLSSLSVREAVRELSLAAYRVADPRRSGGIFLIRDAENRLLGYTEAVTLMKMNAGVGPADALSRSFASAATDSAPTATSWGEAAVATKPWGEAAVATKLLKSPQQDPADLMLLSVLQPFIHVLRVDDNTDELLRQQMIVAAPVLPVIDAEGILVGVVRPRDAMLLMQARIAQFLAGDGDSYSKSTVLFLVKKRVVWLLLLAALNFGVSDGGRLRAMV